MNKGGLYRMEGGKRVLVECTETPVGGAATQSPDKQPVLEDPAPQVSEEPSNEDA